jgi:hypothetical protein
MKNDSLIWKVGVFGIVLVNKKGAKNFLFVLSDFVAITSSAPSLAAPMIDTKPVAFAHLMVLAE